MIIDMTKEIVESIVANPHVVRWVAKPNGVPNISANKLPASDYPAIVVYEIGNEPEKYADGQEETSMITFQISLFSKDGSHGKVQNEIHQMMLKKGFIRVAKVPLPFDNVNNISQRVLIYTQEIEQSLFK